MKNIWLLTMTNMKRNRIAVILSIAGALLLCYMLWALGDMIVNKDEAKIKIGVIDYDQSLLSIDFENYLTEELDYQIITDNNFEQLSNQLIEKEISVIIEVPKGFYEAFAKGDTKNVIITSMDDYENSAYIEVYINNYLSSIQLLAAGAAGDTSIFKQLLTDYNNNEIKLSEARAVSVDNKTLANRMGFINSIGFYLMFVFTASVVLSFIVVEDRIKGLYNRIQVTPVKPLHYIVGTGVFGLFLCLLQIGIYCGYIYFMKLDIGVPIHLLIGLMSLFSLFTISFSIAVAVILKSKNTMTSIIIGFSTVGCILGGAYFPIDMAPKTLQNLARVLPQYWFMDALRSLQMDIKANIFSNITILALYALLSLLIGAVLFAQNYKTN